MDSWITNNEGVNAGAFTPFKGYEKIDMLNMLTAEMEEIMSAYLTYEERLEIEAGLKEHMKWYNKVVTQTLNEMI